MTTRLPKYATIGQRINQIRGKHNLSQKKFSESIGVSRSLLSELESGIMKPSMPVLLAIEYRYGYRWEWVMTGDGEPTVYSECAGGVLGLPGGGLRYDRSTLVWISRLVDLLNGGDEAKISSLKVLLRRSRSAQLEDGGRNVADGQFRYKNNGGGNIQPESKALVDDLIDILESDDTVMKTAITENIKAFKEGVRRKEKLSAADTESDFKTPPGAIGNQGGGDNSE